MMPIASASDRIAVLRQLNGGGGLEICDLKERGGRIVAEELSIP